jgi:hypothetical protein
MEEWLRAHPKKLNTANCMVHDLFPVIMLLHKKVPREMRFDFFFH